MMRMIGADEAMAAQSLPKATLRPDNHRLTMHMTGMRCRRSQDSEFSKR